MGEAYQQLWKAIIRPPRALYKESDLGPTKCKYNGIQVQRTDIELLNKRGYKLKCSYYTPLIKPCHKLPCVIYLHANSSCRLQGRSYIQYLLCHDISMFTFDFSGCGLSQGQYISLGYYQRDDVQTVFQHLRSLDTVTSIGLWGRSMGAVTALMYSDQNPEIACIVLDSPFSNLETLCKELAQKYSTQLGKLGGLLSMFSGVALTFLEKTVKQKNNFEISKIDPLSHVKKAYIPAFFIAAKDDDFIVPEHGKRLHEAYEGSKMFKMVEGDHNSQRDSQVNDAISTFFYNNLLVSELVKKDEQYINQQIKLKKKDNQKQKDIKLKTKINKKQRAYSLSKQAYNYENVFMSDLQAEEKKMLEQAMRLSLLETTNTNSQQKKQQIKKPNLEQTQYKQNNFECQIILKSQSKKQITKINNKNSKKVDKKDQARQYDELLDRQ